MPAWEFVSGKSRLLDQRQDPTGRSNNDYVYSILRSFEDLEPAMLSIIPGTKTAIIVLIGQHKHRLEGLFRLGVASHVLAPS